MPPKKKTPPTADAEPAKRGRGRPPKASTEKAPVPKSRPGRPPKKSPAAKLAKVAKVAKVAKLAKPAKAAKPEKGKVAAAPSPATYAQWVIEAVQAKQSDDKKFVGFRKIQNYIFAYFEEADPKKIGRLSKKAIADLVAKKVLRQRGETVAFVAGAKGADGTAPERAVVRTKPKASRADEIGEGNFVQETRSGRVFLKRF
jgi:hypothetical protein